MTSPYLTPVGPLWARAVGIVLLVAALALTAYLAYVLFEAVAQTDSRRGFNSSTLVFGLILVALCGICWQAGWRLTFRRSGPPGALFSRPAWFAIGSGLVVISALMAAVISNARRPTLLDVQVILSVGGFGVWCLVLALRRER